MRLGPAAIVLTSAFAATAVATTLGQGREGFVERFDHPAIDYYDGTLNDPVSLLEKAIDGGRAQLTLGPDNGYLASVLKALDISPDSQVTVFSQTSLQAGLINPKNPRAIYFNDHAAVAWVRGGPVLEIAAEDPRQGMVFYTLDQKAGARPAFTRTRECLRCHVSWDTFGVPGMFVLSTGPADATGYATGGVVDQRSPLADRWGGWYVTGKAVPAHTMGIALPTLEGRFDLTGYLTPDSDVVALMVLEHQTRMTNLLTYIGWEARVGADEAKLASIARELVDYMLFVNEAPLATQVEGSSAFAARFASLGPKDGRGRSLRQFDLVKRLMRYPCSYMIYSAAFDELPAKAKSAVYERMWHVLSGEEPQARYSRLSAADRQAVLDILRDTKKDLPASFRASTH